MHKHLKAIAVFALVTFVGTSVDPVAFANPSPTPEVSLFSPKILQVPAEFGEVTGRVMGDPKAPALIHIQSAHGNYTAEKNIEKLLQYIEKNSSVKLMLLEGAAGELHPEMFRIFPKQPDFNRKMTDKLMREGHLTGPEVFMINSGLGTRTSGLVKAENKSLVPSNESRDEGIHAFGVEDLDAYKKDRDAFIKVVKADKATQTFLRQMRADLEKRFTSKLNKDLLALTRQEDAFDSGSVALEGWLKILGESSKRHLSMDLSDAYHQDAYPFLIRYYQLQAISAKIDQEKARAEEASFIKELEKRKISKDIIELFEKRLGTSPSGLDQTRNPNESLVPSFESRALKGYSQLRFAFDRAFTKLPRDFSMKAWPAWTLYAQHVILMQEMEGKGLQDEVAGLKEKLETRLAKTAEEKEYLAEARHLSLLRKLFSLELTRTEYEELRDSYLVPRDSKKQNESRVPSPELRSLFATALSFYSTAVVREQKMFANALQKMREQKQRRAVIVTGGFHADGLKRLAEKSHCSYLQITPRIPEVSKRDHEVYLRSMLGNRDIETSQMAWLLGLVGKAQRVAVTGMAVTKGWVGDIHRSIRDLISQERPSDQPGLIATLNSFFALPTSPVPVPVPVKVEGQKSRSEMREVEKPEGSEGIKTDFIIGFSSMGWQFLIQSMKVETRIVEDGKKWQVSLQSTANGTVRKQTIKLEMTRDRQPDEQEQAIQDPFVEAIQKAFNVKPLRNVPEGELLPDAEIRSAQRAAHGLKEEGAIKVFLAKISAEYARKGFTVTESRSGFLEPISVQDAVSLIKAQQALLPKGDLMVLDPRAGVEDLKNFDWERKYDVLRGESPDTVSAKTVAHEIGFLRGAIAYKTPDRHMDTVGKILKAMKEVEDRLSLTTTRSEVRAGWKGVWQNIANLVKTAIMAFIVIWPGSVQAKLPHEVQQFAAKYTTEILMKDPAARDRFFSEVMRAEGQFIQPGVGVDAETGMTVDGIGISYRTGELEGIQRVWTAASKEAPHITILARAIEGNKWAQELVSPDDPSKAKQKAIEILRKKLNSLQAFHREYPGYGGFLPWVVIKNGSIQPATNPTTPEWDWTERTPGLDNGMMAWAIYALVGVLEAQGVNDLAAGYQGLFDLMVKNAAKVFYNGDGYIRAEAGIRDVHAQPSSKNYYDFPKERRGEDYYLNDPYEGELFRLFMVLFSKDLTEDQKKLILQKSMAKLESVGFQTAQGALTVERGHWFSAHEPAKQLLLPFGDIPVAQRVFLNGEIARTHYSAAQKIPGLMASVGRPVPEGQNVPYQDGIGIASLARQPVKRTDIVTPYAAWPVILASEYYKGFGKAGFAGVGAAWYRVMLAGPRMQGPYGSTESVTTDGKLIAPLMTWDSKIWPLWAKMGGALDLVRERLKQQGLYSTFYKIVEDEYTKAFPKVTGDNIPPALPTAEIPTGHLGQFSAAGIPGSGNMFAKFAPGSHWEGDGILKAGHSFKKPGELTLPQASGFIFAMIDHVDLRQKPVVHLTVKTQGEGLVGWELKNTSDQLITSGKTYFYVPHTQGQWKTIAFDMSKSGLTNKNATTGLVVFSDPMTAMEIKDFHFSKEADAGAVVLGWDGAQFKEGAVSVESPSSVGAIALSDRGMAAATQYNAARKSVPTMAAFIRAYLAAGTRDGKKVPSYEVKDEGWLNGISPWFSAPKVPSRPFSELLGELNEAQLAKLVRDGALKVRTGGAAFANPVEMPPATPKLVQEEPSSTVSTQSPVAEKTRPVAGAAGAGVIVPDVKKLMDRRWAQENIRKMEFKVSPDGWITVDYALSGNWAGTKVPVNIESEALTVEIEGLKGRVEVKPNDTNQRDLGNGTHRISLPGGIFSVTLGIVDGKMPESGQFRIRFSQPRSEVRLGAGVRDLMMAGMLALFLMSPMSALSRSLDEAKEAVEKYVRSQGYEVVDHGWVSGIARWYSDAEGQGNRTLDFSGESAFRNMPANVTAGRIRPLSGGATAEPQVQEGVSASSGAAVAGVLVPDAKKLTSRRWAMENVERMDFGVSADGWITVDYALSGNWAGTKVPVTVESEALTVEIEGMKGRLEIKPNDVNPQDLGNGKHRISLSGGIFSVTLGIVDGKMPSSGKFRIRFAQSRSEVRGKAPVDAEDIRAMIQQLNRKERSIRKQQASGSDILDRLLRFSEMSPDSIRATLKKIDRADVAEIFRRMRASEIGEMFSSMDESQISAMFGKMKKGDMSAMFGAMDENQIGAMFGALNRTKVIAMFKSMSPYDLMSMFLGMNEAKIRAMIQAMSGVEIGAMFGALSNAHIALMFQQLSDNKIAWLFNAMDELQIGAMFGAMDAAKIGAMFEVMGESSIVAMLERGMRVMDNVLAMFKAMDLDKIGAMFEAMDINKINAIFGRMGYPGLREVIAAIGTRGVVALFTALDVTKIRTLFGGVLHANQIEWLFGAMKARAIAAMFEALDRDMIRAMFSEMNKYKLEALFRIMDRVKIGAIFKALDAAKIGAMFREMTPDNITVMFGELNADETKIGAMFKAMDETKILAMLGAMSKAQIKALPLEDMPQPVLKKIVASVQAQLSQAPSDLSRSEVRTLAKEYERLVRQVLRSSSQRGEKYPRLFGSFDAILYQMLRPSQKELVLYDAFRPADRIVAVLQAMNSVARVQYQPAGAKRVVVYDARTEFLSWLHGKFLQNEVGLNAFGLAGKDLDIVIRVLGDLDFSSGVSLVSDLMVADQKAGEVHKAAIRDALRGLMRSSNAVSLVEHILSELAAKGENPWKKFDRDGSVAKLFVAPVFLSEREKFYDGSGASAGTRVRTSELSGLSPKYGLLLGFLTPPRQASAALRPEQEQAVKILKKLDFSPRTSREQIDWQLATDEKGHPRLLAIVPELTSADYNYLHEKLHALVYPQLAHLKADSGPVLSWAKVVRNVVNAREAARSEVRLSSSGSNVEVMENVPLLPEISLPSLAEAGASVRGIAKTALEVTQGVLGVTLLQGAKAKAALLKLVMPDRTHAISENLAKETRLIARTMLGVYPKSFEITNALVLSPKLLERLMADQGKGVIAMREAFMGMNIAALAEDATLANVNQILEKAGLEKFLTVPVLKKRLSTMKRPVTKVWTFEGETLSAEDRTLLQQIADKGGITPMTQRMLSNFMRVMDGLVTQLLGEEAMKHSA